MSIIDISNPNSASVVGSLAIPATVRNLDAEGNYAYVIGGYPYLLTVIDISTKNPTIVKTYKDIIKKVKRVIDVLVCDDIKHIIFRYCGI